MNRPPLHFTLAALCYLVRDLVRTIDWEKLDARRRAGLYDELDDALIALMVQGGQARGAGVVGFVQALAARFEMRLHGDDRREAAWINVPAVFVPEKAARLPRKPWQMEGFERVFWISLAAAIPYDDALRLAWEMHGFIASFVRMREAVPRQPERPADASPGLTIAYEEAMTIWEEKKAEVEAVLLGEIAMFEGMSLETNASTTTFAAPLPEKMHSVRMLWTVMTFTAPFAHGADVKSGNTILFRRYSISDPSRGRTFMVPFFSGSALRGDAIRDEGARILCSAVGLRHDGKDCAPHRAHSLFGGGTIDSGAGSVTSNPQQMEEWRNICPLVDLVGGTIRDDSGKIATQMEGMLVPRSGIMVCQENAWLLHEILKPARNGTPMSLDEFRASLKPAHALTEFMQGTTMAHREIEDAPERAQMIRAWEVVREGEQMAIGVALKRPIQHIRPVTASFLAACLENLRDRSRLGAQANAAMGHIAFDPFATLDGETLPSSSLFWEWVKEDKNRQALRSFLLAGSEPREVKEPGEHPLGPEPGSEAAKKKGGRGKKAPFPDSSTKQTEIF